jgi:hypothetical protein
MFQQCLRATWGKNSEAISYCLGNVSLWSTISEVASTRTTIFLIYSLKSKQRLEINKALQFLGGMLLAEGDQATAASLFTVALQGFTQMDVHCSRAECMLRLGDITERDGDSLRAIELWNAARLLFERSQTKQMRSADERLAVIGPVGCTDILIHLQDLRTPTAAPVEVGVASTAVAGTTLSGIDELGREETHLLLVPA